MITQVKFIVGTDLNDLEELLNAHLLTMDTDTSIHYDFEKCIAVIETKQMPPTHLCCECSHWNDHGEYNALLGDCHIVNKRRRYCDKSCVAWKEKK